MSNQVYTERNNAVIAMAAFALAAGCEAGWALDPNWREKGWDVEWATVVYVRLPDGSQVSYHMAPAEAETARALLPKFTGTWDGTFIGREPQWPLRLRETL